jgi:hypothetical protein
MPELIAVVVPNGAVGVVPNGTELFIVVGKDEKPTAGGGADVPNPPPNGLIAGAKPCVIGGTVAGVAIPNGLEVVVAPVVVLLLLLLATPHTEVVLLATPEIDAVDVTLEKGSISIVELLLPQCECEIESPAALPPLPPPWDGTLPNVVDIEGGGIA